MRLQLFQPAENSHYQTPFDWLGFLFASLVCWSSIFLTSYTATVSRKDRMDGSSGKMSSFISQDTETGSQISALGSSASPLLQSSSGNFRSFSPSRRLFCLLTAFDFLSALFIWILRAHVSIISFSFAYKIKFVRSCCISQSRTGYLISVSRWNWIELHHGNINGDNAIVTRPWQTQWIIPGKTYLCSLNMGQHGKGCYEN